MNESMNVQMYVCMHSHMEVIPYMYAQYGHTCESINQSIKIYIMPLQDTYSEALPTQAKRKRTVQEHCRKEHACMGILIVLILYMQVFIIITKIHPHTHTHLHSVHTAALIREKN